MSRPTAVFSIFIVLSLLSALGSGCAKDIVSGRSTYNVYSIDSDAKLGGQVMKMQLHELAKTKKTYDAPEDQKEVARIRTIVNDIASVSHYPNFPYEVHLANVDIVNAWCAPGGKIMVYEGLWDKKKGLVTKGNDDELAAVLAHEIAHANARHVTEAISRNVTIMTLGQIAGSIISTQSSTGGNLFNQMFSQGMNVFIPSYSRKNELEADRVGLVYMAKAGYDPRAAVKLWERAYKMKGDRTSLYATHPSSGIRAKELQKYLPEAMEYYMAAKGSKNAKKPPKKPVKTPR